jgi:hypothetical protein
MKLINYRGGIARFHIPSSWVEEYEPEGGATFYEDTTDSGTLRINVMDIDKPLNDKTLVKTAYDLIEEISGTNSVKRMPSGGAIAHSTQIAIENNKQLQLYTWQIGVCVTPMHFRLITFTFTILAELKFTPGMRQEIAMLDQLISNGEYSTMRGIAGNHFQQ